MTEASKQNPKQETFNPLPKGPQYLLLKTFFKGVGDYTAAKKVFQCYLSPVPGVQDIFFTMYRFISYLSASIAHCKILPR